MHDTLDYMAEDPIHRAHHHQKLTFGQLYAYSENFVLPLSHDEVVHGKYSLLKKMPGDPWQQFANLRLLLACQAAMPGRKLGFMGGEFGVPFEWRSGEELPWGLLDDPAHAGIRRLAGDLNRLYRGQPALHQLDFEPGGFAWIDCNDAAHSVISWERRDGKGGSVVVVMNCTPVPRHHYRLGVPAPGAYSLLLNSDDGAYGGSGVSPGALKAERRAWMERPASVSLTLPPLAALILVKAA
jgi:1,4-alpha-glucan branching enzyme